MQSEGRRQARSPHHIVDASKMVSAILIASHSLAR